jgi:hypothetical protein
MVIIFLEMYNMIASCLERDVWLQGQGEGAQDGHLDYLCSTRASGGKQSAQYTLYLFTCHVSHALREKSAAIVSLSHLPAPRPAAALQLDKLDSTCRSSARLLFNPTLV